MSQSVTEWLTAYFSIQGIDPDKVRDEDAVRAVRQIPCNIHCWRIGGPVDVKVGEPCPECGKPYEGDKLPLNDIERILQSKTI